MTSRLMTFFVMAAVVAAILLVRALPGFAFDRANPPRLHAGGRTAQLGAGSTRAESIWPDANPQYHNGDGLPCADCHITHASQTHTLGAYAPAHEVVPYSGTPGPNLLKASDPVDLCLSCHDNQSFAPDVMGTDANGLQQRSAGHFAAVGISNPNGHDLARGLPRAGSSEFCYRCHFSSGTEKQVTCVDCHNPHGNGRARNLQWASWPEGTPELGVFSNPAASGMSRYERDNVSFGSLDSDMLREASNICLDCHHVFSGGSYVDPNHDGIHERHPTYDSERSSTNRIAQGAAKESTAPAHWNAGVGSGFGATPRVRPVTAGATDYASGRVVNANANGVFCLSCHSAHGSDQPFGLVFPASTGTAAPGCDQCHLIANVPAPPAPLRAGR